MPVIDTTHSWKVEEFLYMLSLFKNLKMILVIAVTFVSNSKTRADKREDGEDGIPIGSY